MSNPSAPSAPIAAAAPKQPSFFEDLIEIVYNPADVFRRRENRSVWPPMLFVAIAITLIGLATAGTLQPLFDAEFARGPAKAMAKNPQMTAEMIDKARSFGDITRKYGVGILTMVIMFLLGSVSWLVGKLFGSRQTYHAALVVAAWAYIPRVVGSILGAVQGLLMDPAKLTGMMSISIGPARFLDPDTPSPLMLQLLGRFDLMTIWVTVLLGVGMYVTGKVTKPKAIAFAIIMWVLGALPALQQAFVNS